MLLNINLVLGHDEENNLEYTLRITDIHGTVNNLMQYSVKYRSADERKSAMVHVARNINKIVDAYAPSSFGLISIPAAMFNGSYFEHGEAIYEYELVNIAQKYLANIIKEEIFVKSLNNI